MRILVQGIPQPQGSKSPRSICGQDATPCRRCKRRHLVRINVVEAVKGLDPWRKHVALVARKHMRGMCPITGPVVVALTFTFDRPKAHFRTGRNAHQLAGKAPAWHIQKPDADKLARAVLDGLTLGGVWEDDAQCVDLVRCAKLWAPAGYADPGTFTMDLPPHLVATLDGADRLPSAGVLIRLGRPREWAAPPAQLPATTVAG
jgi:Holliday junction resolvase RusA-like endonuclease